MIVRTYTAELTGPSVDSGATGVRPVRRLRAWTATVASPWSTFTFRRGSAIPVAVDVTHGDAPVERMPIRSPEAPILGALKAASTAGSLVVRRRNR